MADLPQATPLPIQNQTPAIDRPQEPLRSVHGAPLGLPAPVGPAASSSVPPPLAASHVSEQAGSALAGPRFPPRPPVPPAPAALLGPAARLGVSSYSPPPPEGLPDAYGSPRRGARVVTQDPPAASTGELVDAAIRRQRGRGTPKSPARATNKTAEPAMRILVPVQFSSWTNGDIGDRLQGELEAHLAGLDALVVTRMPRYFVVEAHESAGPMLEAVHRAAVALDKGVETRYPVFHHEIGPLWTGTLQAVFA